jgi:hypothetical protein
MDRKILARMIMVFLLLSMVLPFLPGKPKDPFGLGGMQRAWKTNQRIMAFPPGSADQRAILRFRGMLKPAMIRQLMEFVEEVEVFSRTEAKGETLCVQLRGISRNVMWTLAYDFYPVRVIGRFYEEGGRPDDPILPEADWVLTQLKSSLELERVL